MQQKDGALPAGEIVSIIQRCSSTSRALASFDSVLVDWAGNQEGLHEPFIHDLEPHKDLLDRLPQEWESYMASQYIAGKLFSSGPLVLRALEFFGESLDASGRKLLSSFLDSPWRYSIFSVEREEADMLFTAYDCCTDREILLQSKSVADHRARGARTFMTLVFWNGLCFQTYGPVHAFHGFELFDFEYFARMTDERLYEKKGLGACVMKYAVPFMLLDFASGAGPIGHRRERVVHFMHSVEAVGFSADALPEPALFDVKTQEGVTCMSVKGEEPPFLFGRIYFEAGTSTLTVHAAGLKNYGMLRKILSPRVDFPEKPRVQATMNMIGACLVVLKAPLPWAGLEKVFEENTSLEDDAYLNAMNAFLREAADLYNKGLEIPVEELAEKHHVDPADARRAAGSILGDAKKWKIDLEHGIPGFVHLPPEGRMKMEGPLAGNMVIAFGASAGAEEMFHEIKPGIEKTARKAGMESPSLGDLPGIIDSLTRDVWRMTSSPIAPYTFYLLLKAGDGSWTTDDCASEILRLFWQVLLPNKGKKAIARFIDRYADWCRIVLEPLGLVELRGEGGALVIKRTRFFEEWVRLAE